MENQNSNTPLSSEDAIHYVGGGNRFQWIAMALTSLTFTTSSMISFGIPYLISQKAITLNCHYQDGSSAHCGYKDACGDDPNVVSFDYIHDRHQSLINWVVDYELACWKESSLSLISTAYFAGFLIASILFMPMADYTGRKSMTLAGLALQLIGIVLIFIIPGEWYLYALAAIIGLRSPMASHVTFMLLVEVISPAYRPYFSLIVNGLDSFCVCYLALVYKYLASWQPWFVGVAALSAALIVVDYFYFPESPRFYISRGEFKKAKKSYAWIAKINGKPMFPNPLEGEIERPSDSSTGSVKPPAPKLIDLWRGRSAREKCLLFMYPYFWFTADIVTYGISFSINDLSGSVYTYGMLLGVAGLVTAFSGSVLADKLGRKGSFLINWGIAGLSCILYQFISNQAADYVFIFVGKLGISASFGLCFLMTSQYFPTAFRGLMFGICNVFARVGGVISPQFSTVFAPHHFMLIFGLMSLVTFGLSFILIETKDRKMPDVVERSNSRYKSFTEQTSFLGKESP